MGSRLSLGTRAQCELDLVFAVHFALQVDYGVKLGFIRFLLTNAIKKLFMHRGPRSRTKATHNSDDVDIEKLGTKRLLKLCKGGVWYGLGINFDRLLGRNLCW